MPTFSSIADLLRHKILTAPEKMAGVARAAGVLQPPVWRFVHEGTDPKLGVAERLLAHFGYVLVPADEAHGTNIVRPAREPETARTRQRERNRLKKEKQPTKRRTPKRSNARRRV
jgi:hypothetical protein